MNNYRSTQSPNTPTEGGLQFPLSLPLNRAWVIFKIILAILLSLLILSGSNLFGQSTFKGEKLKSACIDFLKKSVSRDAEISISNSVEDVFFEEKGVHASFSGKPESLRGSCYVGVEFHLNNKLIKRIEIPVRVRFFADVPVAVAFFYKGRTLKQSDLQIARKDITGYKQSELLSIDDIIGKKVKSNINEGMIITRSFIEEEPVIRRGEKVVILVQSGGVTVRTNGEALQDASAGSTVRVKRDDENIILQGSALADGTVLIKAR